MKTTEYNSIILCTFMKDFSGIFYLLANIYHSFKPHWLCVITHAHGTVLPATKPTNAPHPTQLDLPQSLSPSYALQLCSFSWPTAATLYIKFLLSPHPYWTDPIHNLNPPHLGSIFGHPAGRFCLMTFASTV